MAGEDVARSSEYESSFRPPLLRRRIDIVRLQGNCQCGWRPGIVAEAIATMLDGLFAASPVGMALLDRELRYLRINAALAAINGVAAEATIGRSVRDVVPELANAIEPL